MSPTRASLTVTLAAAGALAACSSQPPAAVTPLAELPIGEAQAEGWERWHVLHEQRADLDGDGLPEQIRLHVDAEVDALGRPAFDHGHRWVVAIDGHVIYRRFVPNGKARIRIGETQADASAELVIIEESRHLLAVYVVDWGSRQIRSSAFYPLQL